MNPNPELLKAIANNLSTLSVLLNNLASGPKEEKPKEEPKAPVQEESNKQTITLVELRKELGAYSIAGFTTTIQKILKSHGVKLLKELPEDQYETVLQEVKEACD